MTKINKRAFLKALKNTGGIQSAIAQNLNVTRESIWRFIKLNPDIRISVDQEREKIVDLAEGSLFSQIKEKKEWATKFLLTTIGKNRGYVTKQEIVHERGPEPVQLIIAEKADRTRNYDKTKNLIP